MRAPLCSFWHATTGAVAVETALVTSLILIPMLLGTWDVAQIGFGQAQVQEGLQAAITYAVGVSSSDTAGISSAAQKAYGQSIVVTTNSVCYCVSKTTVATTPSVIACTSSCASGNDFEKFLNITLSKSVTIPFKVPYLGSSVTVTASGQVRTN